MDTRKRFCICVWIRGCTHTATMPPTRKGAAAAAAFVRLHGGKCTRAAVAEHLREMRKPSGATPIRGGGWHITIMHQKPYRRPRSG